MFEIALLGVGILALAALIWSTNRQMGVVLHKISDIQPPNTPSKAMDDALWDSLGGLEKRTLKSIADLTKAVAEGIDHVDRNEKRVRGIVTGAKRRFAAEGYDDPGVEAEFDSLPAVDAGSVEGQGVLPLSNDVGAMEQPGDPWTSVPGMSPIEGA